MNYRIIRNSTAEKVEEDVRVCLREGWELLGGISVTRSDYYSEDHKGYEQDNSCVIYAQAMVKK